MLLYWEQYEATIIYYLDETGVQMNYNGHQWSVLQKITELDSCLI